MQKGIRKLIAAFSGFGLLLLIFDPSTTINSGIEGIEVCLRTLIPSMLPFLVLSSLLVRAISGKHFRILRPICKFCGIPYGAESLITVGLLGGYPMGAKMVADAYTSGDISRKDALHMLAFCNNAGPAFIFGVLGSLFSNHLIPWVIWLIHIASALITGHLLSSKPDRPYLSISEQPVSVVKIIESSTKTMGIICTWVVLFRIVIGLLTKWLLSPFPYALQALAAGILELANGIIRLSQVTNPANRFMVCTLILSFGGLCVFMQTASVTTVVGMESYFPGKVIQSVLSAVLAGNIQFILFPDQEPRSRLFWILCLIITGITIVTYRITRKNSGFYRNSVV